MLTPQSCGEALLIESGLSLPYAFLAKSWAFCLGPPPPPPIELYNFLCEMAPYVEICYAYSGGAEGVPAQKFGLFVTAGGPTAASSADRLLAHTQQAFTEQNNDRRCSDFDYNQSHALS